MSRSPRKNRRVSTIDDPLPGSDPLAGGGDDSRTPIERASEQDELEVLNRLRQEAGNGGYVRLYRRMDGDVKYASITRIEIAEYSEDNIRRVYGGGYYRLRFCTAGNTVCGERSLIIDPTIPYKNPEAAAVEEEMRKKSGGPGQGQQDITAIIKQVQEAAASKGGDSMAVVMPLMLQMIQSADRRAEMMAQALAAKKDEGGSIVPVLMEMIKSERARAEQRTPINETLETFNLFKKITGGGRGGDDDDDDEPGDFWGKLSKVLKGPAHALGAGLASQFTGAEFSDDRPPVRRVRQVPAAGAAASPGAEPGPGGTVEHFASGQPDVVVNGQDSRPSAVMKPAPAFPPLKIPPAMKLNPLVVMMINRLRNAALKASAEKKDPVKFCEWLIGQIPPAYYDDIFNACDAPDWFEQLAALDPVALEHKEWLTQLREAILDELELDDEPEPGAGADGAKPGEPAAAE